MKMAMCTQDNLKLAKLMDKVITHGKVKERSMTENGTEVIDTDMEFGRMKKEIVIQVSGSKGKLQVMVCLLGVMETSTKENGILI